MNDEREYDCDAAAVVLRIVAHHDSEPPSTY